MDEDIRKKYTAFVTTYIGRKICLGTTMKNRYGEKFFDDAIKDNILQEIEKNDIGQRQFVFTKFARNFV